MDGAAIAVAARVVLAVVLIAAAVAKLRHPMATRAQTVALVGARSGPRWLPRSRPSRS